MGKYLTGSAKTGKKIIDNWDLFSYTQTKHEKKSDSDFYGFEWNFDGQVGYISIPVKDGKISNGSQIGTNSGTSHPFGRPLGLYNDSSLELVFTKMLQSINISVSDVYSDN